MNDNTPTKEKLRDLIGKYTYLGSDADGTDHYWDSVTHTAWIVADGAVRCPQSVRDLGDYVEHVEDVAGWEVLKYDDRSLEAFAAAAGGAP